MNQWTRGLTVLILALGACDDANKTSMTKQNDLGTGINTVTHSYPKSATETWEAAETALKSQDLKIESDRHDALGGDLQARRANGEKVDVHVRSLDDHSADVSVRVEPGNKNMASLLHEKIAEKLGVREEAKAALFGGNTAEGVYPNAISSCVKAAEDASKRLTLVVTHREVSDESARVNAQEADLNPVQFLMKKMESGTKVTFVAGHDKSDANKDLSRRMKLEFEIACTSKSN